MRFHFPVIIIDEDFRSENASGLGIRALVKAIEEEVYRQQAANVAALEAALQRRLLWGGGVVAALALLEGAELVDNVWAAVSLDERWQLDQWGSDEEAERALALREADFRAADRFLSLLP